MHLLIYWGFMLLVLMHGLEAVTSERLLPDYYSTLNPYLFLRDLAALMVLAGAVMALCRRFIVKTRRLQTGGMDVYAIVIVAVIILSGILLEGVKITSHRSFERMEEEYASLGDEAEVRALESYWVKYCGVVSPNLAGPFDEETLSQGKEIHEMNCMGCHSSPKWAFTGYAAAKVLKSVATGLDRARVDEVLWVIHFMVCFFGLAYLPFSKMFHIIASPLSLMVNAVMQETGAHTVDMAAKQMMELDACTHCGACTTRCAVGVVFEEIPNVHILPSEKIAPLKKLARGDSLQVKDIRVLQEGLVLCTNCHRCTDVCPAGIDLQAMWHKVREWLLGKGAAEPFLLSPLSLYRGLLSEEMGPGQYEGPVKGAKGLVADQYRVVVQDDTLGPDLRDPTFSSALRVSSQGGTFSHCYNCMTCTDACPVMHNYENPQKELGLVPHQIMQATALGLKDLILGSKMLWACLGCYRCQEQCPQGVRVTDVFYELKNLSLAEIKKETAE
jgi:heterodisulfide reductase subunit C